MTLRLFIHLDDADDEATSLEAHAVPARGDRIWVKTVDGTIITAVVANIEHQFDRSSGDVYGNQDVVLWCSTS